MKKDISAKNATCYRNETAVVLILHAKSTTPFQDKENRHKYHFLLHNNENLAQIQIRFYYAIESSAFDKQTTFQTHSFVF